MLTKGLQGVLRCPSRPKPALPASKLITHRAARRIVLAGSAASAGASGGQGINPSAAEQEARQNAPHAQAQPAATGATASGPGAGGHTDAQAPPAPPPATTFLGKLKRAFLGDSKLDKQRLAALGFGAFSAYGVISNINAGILITISWLTVVRTTGLTPLDGNNWPTFLAVYAGLWVGSNFLRPVRLSLAIAAAPLFDAAISAVSRATRLPKVPAFVLMLLCIALATSSLLVATLGLLGGFPPGCRMPWQPPVPA